MPQDFLIPEAILTAHLDAQFLEADALKSDSRIPKDSTCERALCYYRLLTEWQFDATKHVGIDEKVVFYSRYYWFKLYCKLWTSQFGYDAGLEQQAFQIIESGPDGIDWSVVEDIDRLTGDLG